MRFLAIVGLILAAAPALAADGFTRQDRDMVIEFIEREGLPPRLLDTLDTLAEENANLA